MTPSVIGPHQSAIEAPVDILRSLHKLHESPSVVVLRKQVNDLITIVACVAKDVETIRLSPQIAAHSFLSSMDHQACEYGQAFQPLNVDIRDFHAHFSDLMESGVLRGIFLRIFATHGGAGTTSILIGQVKCLAVGLGLVIPTIPLGLKWRRLWGTSMANSGVSSPMPFL
ncbi:hypothetical protein BDN71DRAFT_1512204 [Pleurotus eryngii]|uniref:Uncharacterized protein n=1 Tax=Pleurotus eryngii TaxID=5323 RepID=A0A9P5ZKB5_PLEER|nr:hypothetical protein BDN71DRAFT_1512204 [Pleurotus eryngii]